MREPAIPQLSSEKTATRIASDATVITTARTAYLSADKGFFQTRATAYANYLDEYAIYETTHKSTKDAECDIDFLTHIAYDAAIASADADYTAALMDAYNTYTTATIRSIVNAAMFCTSIDTERADDTYDSEIEMAHFDYASQRLDAESIYIPIVRETYLPAGTHAHHTYLATREAYAAFVAADRETHRVTYTAVGMFTSTTPDACYARHLSRENYIIASENFLAVAKTACDIVDQTNCDAAAKALDLIGESAVGPLIDVLVNGCEQLCNCPDMNQGESEEQRQADIKRVQKIKDLKSANRTVVVKLGDIGKPAVDALIEILVHVNPLVRANVASALGRIRDIRAVESLIKALKDDSRSVRESAAIALGRIKDIRAVDPLIKALNDGYSFVVRESAAIALGRIKDRRAVDSLITTLKDDETVRTCAIYALGEIGEAAVDPLIKILENSDSKLRQIAAISLGYTRHPRAIDPLTNILGDEDQETRQCAAEALDLIKNTQSADLVTHKQKEPVTCTTREQLGLKVTRIAAGEQLSDLSGYYSVTALIKAGFIWDDMAPEGCDHCFLTNDVLVYQIEQHVGAVYSISALATAGFANVSAILCKQTNANIRHFDNTKCRLFENDVFYLISERAASLTRWQCEDDPEYASYDEHRTRLCAAIEACRTKDEERATRFTEQLTRINVCRSHPSETDKEIADNYWREYKKLLKQQEV
jgi:HEAT repeat protein